MPSSPRIGWVFVGCAVAALSGACGGSERPARIEDDARVMAPVPACIAPLAARSHGAGQTMRNLTEDQYWQLVFPSYDAQNHRLPLNALTCTGGKVFDKWYDKGATITMLRRTGMGIGMFGAALFIWLCMLANSAFWAIFWLSAFAGIFAFGASNVWAIPSDIAPYGQAGGVGGVYNFVGNFGVRVFDAGVLEHHC